MKPSDRIGMRFGRLLVIDVDGCRKQHVICVCDCGNVSSVNVGGLDGGRSRSCGCYRRELMRDNKTTHGQGATRTKSRLYRCWANMKTRCYNPKSDDYHNYGGRGIRVYGPWINDFVAFATYVGEPPDGKTLDRIRVNDGYEPGNVKWSTPAQQARNRRPRRRVVRQLPAFSIHKR